MTDAAPREGWYFDWPGWTIVVHAPDDLLRDAARPENDARRLIDAEIAREKGLADG